MPELSVEGTAVKTNEFKFPESGVKENEQLPEWLPEEMVSQEVQVSPLRIDVIQTIKLPMELYA